MSTKLHLVCEDDGRRLNSVASYRTAAAELRRLVEFSGHIRQFVLQAALYNVSVTVDHYLHPYGTLEDGKVQVVWYFIGDHEGHTVRVVDDSGRETRQ